MALIPSSGTQGFDLGATNTRHLDISEVLVTYLQRVRSMLSITPLGEEFVTETHAWDEDKLNPDTITDTAGIPNSSANANFALSAADAALLRIGYVFEPSTTMGASTSEQVQVIATDGSTFATVTRGYGGSTVGSHGANTVWKLVADPTQASTDVSKDLTRARVAKTNLVYRWEFSVILGYEAIMQAIMGYVPGVRNEMAYQFKKRLDEEFRTLQTAYWMSRVASSGNAATGKDYSTMWGLWKYLDGTANTTSTVGQSSGTFSDSTVNSMSQFIVQQGGNANVLVGNTNIIGRMSLLDKDKVRTDYHETSRGQLTKVYTTPYGHDLRLILDPVLNDTVGSLQAAVLDMARIRLLPYAGSFLNVIQAPVNYDGDITRVVSRSTLEPRNTGTDIGQSHQIALGMS